MKKYLRIFIPLLPLMIVACSKEIDGPAVVSELKAVKLTGEDLTMIVFESDNASFDFKVVAQPADAVYTASEFVFKLDGTGDAPDYVKFTPPLEKNTASGELIFTVSDDGTYTEATPYYHTVVVVHTPTGIQSSPFVVTRLPKEQQREFSLSLESVPETLDIGASAELTVSVNPSTEHCDGNKFRLFTEDDTASEYVDLEYVDDADGIYTFNLKDKRTEYVKYSEVLKVVYEGESQPIMTQTFIISSAEARLVSKVYITLDEGLSRTKDLDGKASTIIGYKEDGSGFETQYSIDNRDWVDATIRIEGADGFDDLDEMATKIKGRGNSTWGWDKKPYNLKLDSKSKILGMKKHKRWCLIANAIDRTHLRNWLAYNISRQMSFDYAVHCEFVELYFIEANGNKDYRGLYLLTEHIKEDKDSRVPITEVKESQTGVAGDQIGYLLEFDMYYDEPGRFLTSPSRLPVNVKYPAQDDWEDAGNMEQYNTYKEYISNYVSEVDKLINELQKDGDSNAIWEKLDIESMANFWIVLEAMCSREVLWPKSIYFHKEVGEKLKAGPTWDFDYGTLNATDAKTLINYPHSTTASIASQYWAKKTGGTWWAQLIDKDARFRAEVKKQWAAVYPKMQAIQQLEIDNMKAVLRDADERNAELWDPGQVSSKPNLDYGMTFEQSLATLKSNFDSRIAFLNEQINNMD